MVHGPPDAHTLHSSNCRIGNIYLTHPFSLLRLKLWVTFITLL
jgi:hypothetical protein